MFGPNEPSADNSFTTMQKHWYIRTRRYPVGEISLDLAIYYNDIYNTFVFGINSQI
jgi:hypothetical protein